MHLYQCTDAAMRKLLTNELNDFEDALQKRHLPFDIWEVMKAGIDSYCSPGYSGAFTPRTVRARVAYVRQSAIGWDQFLKGRLACEWGQEMSTLYSASADLNYTETRRRFVTTAISQLWHMYDEVWSLRNNKLYDETDIHALSTEELNRRIRYFYSNKTTLFDGGDFDRFHLGSFGCTKEKGLATHSGK